MVPLTIVEQNRIHAQTLSAAASLLPPGPVRDELEREAREFELLATDEEWPSLPLLGEVDSGIPGVRLELRNRADGSTISRARRGGAYLSREEYRALEARDE